MSLCINQSGTWRDASTVCVNQSGTWRCIATGCINQSGTWRCFGFYSVGNCPLGSNVEGGYLICKSSGVAWIVAPASSEVSRNWYLRSNAVTRAQQVSGCSGWFVPTCSQLKNPGEVCKTYWDSCSGFYWSNTAYNSIDSWVIGVKYASTSAQWNCATFCVRAFRCVTY